MNDGSFAECPRCQGRGPFMAFVTRADGTHTTQEMPCDFCTGTGDVTHEKAHAYTKGRELYRIRVTEGRSVFETAKLLGMSSSEYSGIEHGRRHCNYEQVAQRIKDWL